MDRNDDNGGDDDDHKGKGKKLKKKKKRVPFRHFFTTRLAINLDTKTTQQKNYHDELKLKHIYNNVLSKGCYHRVN